jgi:hypothetical protein
LRNIREWYLGFSRVSNIIPNSIGESVAITSRRLRYLLECPEDDVGCRLLDSQPLELGRDLAAVVGRMVDHVPQYDPRG